MFLDIASRKTNCFAGATSLKEVWRMFHLSLPVNRFHECLRFYVDCFGARVVMLGDQAANLFVFGAQVTFHDKPDTPLGEQGRKQMHFGQVVPADEWMSIRDVLIVHGHEILLQVPPGSTETGRGKLVVEDPSGNLVEINSHAPA
jgi:extradiol dioxygenase family protein